MNRLKVALTSSVGKKFVMGITGLLLCAFLVAHLAGNVLMLVGPDAYNAYVHKLHSAEWLVKIAEVGLVVLFAAHIYLAFALAKDNRSARGPESYARKDSKIPDRNMQAGISPENWMFVTGAVVLAFLILHLADFTFEVRGDIDYAYFNENPISEVNGEPVRDAYGKAKEILKTPPTFVVYLIGCLFLGWHLGHGVASAFQSLGINHPRLNPIIRNLGILFAIVIAVGFGLFPLWAIMN